MKGPKVAAVVVTFNRRELLTRCLVALENQTQPLRAIIVIDNASTDGTDELIRSISSKGAVDIVYKPLEANLGGAGGFHCGVTTGLDLGFDWLWLMDDDALPESNALEALIKTPGVMDLGLAVPAIQNPDGSPQQRVMDSVVSNDKLFLGISHDNLKNGGIIFSYPLLGLLVNRAKIEAAGNVRADYFIQADDLEWTLRLSSNSGIQYVPNAVLKHFDEVRLDRVQLSGKAYSLLARKDLWKDYYGFRNLILTMRLRNLPGWRLRASRMLMQRLIKRVILRKDVGFSMQIYVRAYLDGMMGRSGKRLMPGAIRWISPCV